MVHWPSSALAGAAESRTATRPGNRDVRREYSAPPGEQADPRVQPRRNVSPSVRCSDMAIRDIPSERLREIQVVRPAATNSRIVRPRMWLSGGFGSDPGHSAAALLIPGGPLP